MEAKLRRLYFIEVLANSTHPNGIKMKYRLWIDDDAGKLGIASFRNPPIGEYKIPWLVAHTSQEAIDIIKEFGLPDFIDFDHDLGTLPDGSTDTSMIVIDYLINNHFDACVDFKVHSKNPVGAANIESKMMSWHRARS